MRKRKIVVLFMILLLLLFGCAESKITTGESEEKLNSQLEGDLSDYQETLLYENVKHGFSVSFPSSWAGNYEVDEAENVIRFLYRSESDGEAELVTIFVVKEEDWEQDELGQLRYLTTSNGYVYYFVLPLDNPFTKEAEIREYSLMVQAVHVAMSTFQLKDTDVSGSPKLALELFFHGFQTDNYQLAAQFYGGEYEWIYEKLKQYRDSVTLDDHVGILRGFIEDLEGEVTYISEVHAVEYIAEQDWHQFHVSLVTNDGQPYAPFGDEGPLTFHVKAVDGVYKVLELPSITMK